MQITIDIEDNLLEKAVKLTGITERAVLVRLGLEALIVRESAKQLVDLGGTEKNLHAIPRR